MVVQTDNNRLCKVTISGNWQLDKENSCWYADADRSSLPDNVYDPNGLLSNMIIPYSIADDESLGNFNITPSEAKAGDTVKFDMNLEQVCADSSMVYRITPNGDGSYSAKLRFSKLASTKFSEADGHHVYTADVTTADSGEYLAAFSDGWNYYITGNLRTLTIKNDRLPGDVNGDGKIDITDATEVQKFAAELIDMTEKQKQSADTNRDGRIDVTDATLIQMYVAGLIAEF